MPRGHQYDLIYWHQKAHVNTEQVPQTPPPPGHTIILFKSNQFTMATIPVKRSIFFSQEHQLLLINSSSREVMGMNK